MYERDFYLPAQLAPTSTSVGKTSPASPDRHKFNHVRFTAPGKRRKGSVERGTRRGGMVFVEVYKCGVGKEIREEMWITS